MAKNNKIIITILVFLILITSILLFFPLQKTKFVKDKSQKTITVLNKEIEVKTYIHLEIKAFDLRYVYFSVDGKLEKGELNLKNGSRFKKNDLLFQLNNEIIYNEINALKKDFSNLLYDNLSEIKSTFPLESKKWRNYYESITPVDLIKELPKFNSTSEQSFFDSLKITDEFKKIMSKENQLINYFYFSPNNAIIEEIYQKNGNYIKKHQKIAKTHSDKFFELNFKINQNELSSFKKKKELDLFLKTNEIYKINMNSLIQNGIKNDSITFKILLETKKINPVEIDKNRSFRYSKRVLSYPIHNSQIKNGRLKILKNKIIKFRELEIIKQTSDSTWVTNFRNGEKIIVD